MTVAAESNHPFAQLGYDCMAACFEVHRVLGGGLLEETYQESLELELQLRGIEFVPKQQLAIFYKNRELNKRYVPDLVVGGHIIVELKAVQALTTEHERQLLNYMRLSRQPVGYLVNFAPIEKVEWKRLVLSQFADRPVFNSLATYLRPLAVRHLELLLAAEERTRIGLGVLTDRMLECANFTKPRSPRTIAAACCVMFETTLFDRLI